MIFAKEDREIERKEKEEEGLRELLKCEILRRKESKERRKKEIYDEYEVEEYYEELGEGEYH